MALANPNLKKVGSSQVSPNTSGHSQMQLVQPATALPNPGGFNGDPMWHRRYAEWRESVQITQKFSLDWE